MSTLSTVYNVWAKKSIGSYVWWHWILIQHLKENWLALSKMIWGIIANFHQSTFESLKIWVWWDPFIQSRNCMSLKFTGGFCVMTLKNDTKFEQELTCQFKIEMKHLKHFDQGTQKIKNLHFNRLLLSKVFNAWPNKVQGSYVW